MSADLEGRMLERLDEIDGHLAELLASGDDDAAFARRLLLELLDRRLEALAAALSDDHPLGRLVGLPEQPKQLSSRPAASE